MLSEGKSLIPDNGSWTEGRNVEHSEGTMTSFSDSEVFVPLKQWRLEDLCFSQESVQSSSL